MPNYSGKWNLDGQLRGIKQGTWTGIPFELDYGPLYSWGNNTYGQLGQDDVISRSSPVQVGALTTVQSVACGENHVHFITSDAKLYSIGLGAYGRTGLDDEVYISSPVQVGALTNWSNVSGSGEHSVAVKTDGTLWAWGRNLSGALGDGTAIDRSSPVQIGALTNWSKAVAGGQNYSLALKTDGTLWAWGRNSNGQLGLNLNINDPRSSPVQVGASTTWTDVSAGEVHAQAIDAGEMYSWGYGNFGSTGLNDRVSYSSPVQVGALTNWSSVTTGLYTTHSIKTDGTLWAWGFNSSGALGDNSAVLRRSSPVQIGSDSDWLVVSGATGGYGATAIKTDGTLWTWGAGASGESGQSDVINISSPIQIGSGTDWRAVARGNFFVFAGESSQGRTGMS